MRSKKKCSSTQRWNEAMLRCNVLRRVARRIEEVSMRSAEEKGRKRKSFEVDARRAGCDGPSR